MNKPSIAQAEANAVGNDLRALMPKGTIADVKEIALMAQLPKDVIVRVVQSGLIKNFILKDFNCTIQRL